MPAEEVLRARRPAVARPLGKAVLYGVYDLSADAGWVSVGVEHDTAAFAVETLRRWWRNMVSAAYPRARPSAGHRGAADRQHDHPPRTDDPRRTGRERILPRESR